MAAAVVLAQPPLAGVVSLNWGDGACVLQVSSFSHRPHALVAGGRWSPPPRPSLGLHRELYIHRFLPDGRPWSDDAVHLPDIVHDASRLLSPSNARAVFFDMVQAMGHVGLPDAALRLVMGTVRSYVRDVAAWALGCGVPPPLSTHVRVTVHVSITLEEETMGDNDGEQQRGSPPTAAWLETDGAGDELAGWGSSAGAEGIDDDDEEEAEAEKECCAICLEGMPRRQRRWLPCSHAFHRDCVRRWLLQKAECPLCRRQVTEAS